jgi:hypothetical protein
MSSAAVKPLSGLPELLASDAMAQGDLRFVLLNPHDLSIAPTGRAYTQLAEQLRKMLLAPSGAGFTNNDPLVVGPTTFNGLTYAWPGTQSANAFLKTDGSGNLSWTTVTGSLATLSDVALGSLATGQWLFYNGATSKWNNSTATLPTVATLGDTLYASGPNAWGRLGAGTAFQFQQMNAGASAPQWHTLVAADITNPAALTQGSDTNVTLTLGGTPASALLAAASITVGWSGTLAAARLNANVVQGFTNDTNVTATISAQVATLGWSGQLAVARGGSGLSTYIATGGMAYALTATSLGVLGIGAANTVLTSTGSAPQWSTSLTLAGSLTAATGVTVTAGGLTVSSGTSALQAVTAAGLVTANAGATIASGQTLTLTGATIAGAPTWSSNQAITLSTASQPNVTTMSALVTVGTIGTGTWQATTIAAGFGGTGLASYTTGDTLYFNSGTTLSKLGIAAANAVMTSSGSAPQWSANLAYATLPTGNGSWDTGAATTITITRSLTVSGTLTGTLTGSITGNAATATKLATARNINDVAFDGTGDITVTAAAGTLTGATLNATVTASSLTSFGTIVSGAVPASLVTAGTFGAGLYAFAFAAATNDADHTSLQVNSGSDGTLGPLGFSVVSHPSATAGSRYVQLLVGDNTGYRTLKIDAGLMIIGGTSAGGLLVGSDPGGAQAFRVGGSAHIGGAVTLDAALGAAGLITASAGLTVASGQTFTITGGTIAGAPTWSSSQAITLSTASQPNVTTMAALVTVGTITTGAWNAGAITTNGRVTSTQVGGGAWLVNVSNTTGAVYGTFTNTGGSIDFGVESSVGGSIATGASAYDTVIANTNASGLSFATNSVVRGRFDASGNLTVGASFTLGGTLIVGSDPGGGQIGRIGGDFHASGVGTFNGGLNLGGAIVNVIGAGLQMDWTTLGTGIGYMRAVTTGANMRLGVEGSAGGAILTSAPAYAAVFGTENATAVVLGTNGGANLIIASGGATSLTSSSGQAFTIASTAANGIYTTYFNGASPVGDIGSAKQVTGGTLADFAIAARSGGQLILCTQGSVPALTIASGSTAVTLASTLTIGGALSGVTTLAMGGALSGVTTLTTSSTINGQTVSATAAFTGTMTIATSLVIGSDPGGIQQVRIGSTLHVGGGVTLDSTLVTGAINGQTISSTAAFTGTVGVAGLITGATGAALATGTMQIGGNTQATGTGAGINLFTLPANNGTLIVFVAGKDASGSPSNAFLDIVVVNSSGATGTPHAVTSTTTVGSPGARTYTDVTGNFRLAIASGINWWIDFSVMQLGS